MITRRTRFVFNCFLFRIISYLTIITIGFIVARSMPRRVIKVDRVIPHITIPIPRLRIGRVGNQAIGLQKVVNIRRTLNFGTDKEMLYVLKVRNARRQLPEWLDLLNPVEWEVAVTLFYVLPRPDRFSHYDFRLEALSAHRLWLTQVTMKPVRSQSNCQFMTRRPRRNSRLTPRTATETLKEGIYLKSWLSNVSILLTISWSPPKSK